MKLRRLGRTGLKVSNLCLGTMTFGNDQWGCDEPTSGRIVSRFLDAGGNFIDTADIYSNGVSEEITGRAIRGKRQKIVLATKVAGPMGSGPNDLGVSRRHILDAIDASLRRLGTDYIDLYQTHWPDPELPIDETLEGLTRAIEQGKVRVAGCSNQTAYGLTKSLWASDVRGLARYETIQNNFSLLNRRFEDELAEVCRREKVSLLPYSPIAGGVLSGKYQDGAFPAGARFSRYKDESPRTRVMTTRFVNAQSLAATTRFAKLAADAGMSTATLAVAWTLSRDFVGSTIIGATSAAQLTETLRGAEVKLGDDVLAACDAVSREIRYPLG